MKPTFKTLVHPDSLERVTHRDISRQELPDIPVRAFWLTNVLSPEECMQYIEETERAGYTSLTSEYPSDLRSNDRLLSLSRPCAKSLFERVVPHFNTTDCLLQPMGMTGCGLWIPYGINECFRFGRTQTGCVFHAHLDGPWAPDEDRCSIYTILIYLNDSSTPVSFTGGQTNFVYDDDGDHNTVKERPILCSITPKMGCALIFKHETLHEAVPVLSGTKYILRTEIMFRRTWSALGALRAPVTSNDMQIAKLLTESQNTLHDLKDTSSAYQQFSEGLALQSRNADVFVDIPLTPSLWSRILEFQFRPEDMPSLFLINSSFYRMMRMDKLWHKSVLEKHPLVPQILGNPHPMTIDWFNLFVLCKRLKPGSLSDASLGKNLSNAPVDMVDIFGTCFAVTPALTSSG